jgi:hypothetical protein
LRESYEAIRAAVAPANPNTKHGHARGSLVILDGLSELLWMGFEAVQVGRFVRATLGLTTQVSTTGNVKTRRIPQRLPPETY